LSFKDQILIFISKFLGKLFCKKCWKKHEKLKKLFVIGSQKIKSELNIVKIVKDLRNLKILIKNSLMDSQMKFQIQHAEENLIDLDESE